jgi:16S rRNA processing protein RimM
MSNLLNIGRVTSVFGIKGWVKIHSQTEPAENLFNYQPWYLKTKHGLKTVELADWKPHGKGFVAQIVGIEDRNQAELLCPVDIVVEKVLLPALDDGEFYWHELENLRVFSDYEGKTYDLGTVKSVLATGANDVLAVVGDEQSIDQKERLIPYLPDQVIKKIAVTEGYMRVDWDPDF